MTDLLDTGPLPAADEAPRESARTTLTPREAWRKAKVPLAIGLVLAAVAVVQAIAAGRTTLGELDPESASPDGARAVAELLRDRGVDVRRVDSPSGSAGTTVFIPLPDLVNATNPTAFSDARGAARLVVAGPSDFDLERLDVDAETGSFDDVEVLAPGCPDPDAAAAGPVLLGGTTYRGGELASGCYAGSMLVVEEGRRRVTLLGSADFLTNDRLDEEGNAALALRLLGAERTLEWVWPRTLPAVGDQPESLRDLLPRRVVLFASQVFVALLFLALWRGRRLGPVVVEPLPVHVRAAETVEGRARLYEAARARDQAANALRAGLRDRLVRVLGLAPDAPPQMLIAAVTARTGRDPVAMTDLLYGPPPADDVALVRLAADLDQLDTEVRAL